MDHLTDAQFDKLKAQLEQLLTDLEMQIKAFDHASAPVKLDTPIGRLSRMDAMQEQGLSQQKRDRARLQLQQVKAALKRMAEGEYGVCLKSGEPIPYARLEAMPEVPIAPEPKTK